MSMLSSKLDAVSRNSIWAEHVRKETKNLRLNDEFAISDPRKMDILPEKPNHTVPTANPDQFTVTSATNTLQSLSCLKDTDKLPTERFALPVTGNMEYGFFSSKPLVPVTKMFDHKSRSCDVTEYAATYVRNAGKSPYTRVDGSGK